MVRYEVEVRKGPCYYAVDVLIYHNRDRDPMLPRLPMSVLRSGGPPFFVHAPNFFERLVGVTLESKLERAKRKAQRIVDRENAKVARFNSGAQ